MSENAVSSPAIKLTLIDLSDESEFEELRQQRVLCGWNYDRSYLEEWRDAMSKKLKSLFWITLDDDPRRIGHVSLDAYSTPPDPDLATADRTVMTIQTFFILQESRSKGLGGHIMDIVEDMATKEPYGSPNCKTITVNTLSNASLKAGLPIWIPMWEKAGIERPEWSYWSKEDWYNKRGYVKWKEDPRYDAVTAEAKVASLDAAFLRKAL